MLMRRPASIVLIAAITSIASLAENPKPSPSTKPASADDALVVYARTLREAQNLYRQTIIVAKQKLLTRLDAALRKAQSAGDLEEALNIQATIDRVKTELQNQLKAQAQANSSVKIVSARWGGGKKWVDVTDTLVELLSTPGAELVANPATLKSDPTPRWRKSLQITILRDAKEETLAVREGSPIVILGYVPDATVISPGKSDTPGPTTRRGLFDF